MGTQALYAYETACGVRVQTDATATQDIDLLLDTRKYLQFTSKNKTTASRLKIRGSCDRLFFTLNGATAGTSKYFKLPQKVSGISQGDLLVFYASQYNEPSSYSPITKIEGDILTLENPQPSDVSWTFNPSATVPFARVQPLQVFDYDAFKQLLDVWAAQEEQQPAYFTDLNRFINPLITNSSPTGVAVGDALNKVKSLASQLTIASHTAYGGSQDPIEEELGLFTVDQVAAVDALLRSFRDKGADRAIDYLIGGQFQAFFAMDQDDASYAGSMQKAMRGVVLNDLSMSKTNRADAKVSRLLASTKDPDPDFDLSDTENAVPDPVGQRDF